MMTGSCRPNTSLPCTEPPIIRLLSLFSFNKVDTTLRMTEIGLKTWKLSCRRRLLRFVRMLAVEAGTSIDANRLSVVFPPTGSKNTVSWLNTGNLSLSFAAAVNRSPLKRANRLFAMPTAMFWAMSRRSNERTCSTVLSITVCNLGNRNLKQRRVIYYTTR